MLICPCCFTSASDDPVLRHGWDEVPNFSLQRYNFSTKYAKKTSKICVNRLFFIPLHPIFIKCGIVYIHHYTINRKIRL